MMVQHVQRNNNMFNMFSSPPQLWLSPNSPPQAVVDPNPRSQGTLPMTYGLQEAKKSLALKPEIQVRCSSSHTSNYTPMSREGEIRWTDLAGNLHGQFGMKKNMIKVTEELNKLSQEGSVIDYWDRFEELRSLLWSDQPVLTEHYFVSRFVNGLKDKLRSMVKMMMSTTVKEAAERARLQELALEAIFRKQEWQPNSYIKGSQLIEGASKAANYGQQESEGNLELDRPIKTENSSNKERSDMDISKNYSLYLQETDGVASEYEDDVADRFHANDGRQPRNEDLDQRKKQEVEDLHNPAAAMPATIEDLEAAIQDTISQANSILFLNNNILEEYESRQKKIEELSKKQELDEKQWSRQLDELNTLKESWLPRLRSLVAQINETFSHNFQEMAVAGEVSLGEHDMDFDKYGILIKVKFRQAGQLQVLSAHHQSGGERSVSTILYLVSLQDLTNCPFRVVDEINQGMAGLAVAASHSTNVFEENDTKRQKEKKTQDKHKKRRRRSQIARAGIG